MHRRRWVSKRTVLFLDVRLREQEMCDLFCQNTFPCFVANCQDQVCKCKLLHLQALAFRGSAIRLVCWRHGSQSMIFTVQRMRPLPTATAPRAFSVWGASCKIPLETPLLARIPSLRLSIAPARRYHTR